MIVQDAREWLEQQIKAFDTDGKWKRTLSVTEEFSGTRTVEIGHAPPTPDTFAKRRVTVPVRWVVKQSNEQASVRDMYTAISFAPDSIIGRLLALDQIRAARVTDVGPSMFGPSGFIFASTEFDVLMDDTTTPTDEESS